MYQRLNPTGYRFVGGCLIFNTGCDLNLLYLLLGVTAKNIKNILNRKLFNVLAYAASKSVFLKWISIKQ